MRTKSKNQRGLSTTREYDIWAKMRLRCYYPLSPNYRFYGGIGTYVCKRWRGSFLDFFADMGKAPTILHTLDRKNTHGHYTCGKCEECLEKSQPANCRWVTKDVQARNQKSCRHYTHAGETLILKDWAKKAGMPYLTLWNRLNRGMPFADAISIKRYDRGAITQSLQQAHEEQ